MARLLPALISCEGILGVAFGMKSQAMLKG